MPATVKVSDMHVDYLRDDIGYALGDYLQSRGFFTENPVRVWKEHGMRRFSWRFLSVLVFIFSGLGVGLWLGLVSPALGAIVGVGLLIFGLVVLNRSVANVRKITPTPTALMEISQWRAFKKYLESTKAFAQEL